MSNGLLFFIHNALNAVSGNSYLINCLDLLQKGQWLLKLPWKQDGKSKLNVARGAVMLLFTSHGTIACMPQVVFELRTFEWVSTWIRNWPSKPFSHHSWKASCFVLINFAAQCLTVERLVQTVNLGFPGNFIFAKNSLISLKVGQTAGYFLGYVFYMALESYKILTLSDFLYFWGCVFMVATTLVSVKIDVNVHS